MISLIEAYKRIDKLKKNGFNIKDEQVLAIFTTQNRQEIEMKIAKMEMRSKPLNGFAV